MKAPLSSARFSPGFTLIELLTVIAIIAVLMGLLFPALSSVKNSAKKARAKNDAVQIVNAVRAYYTEYGRYPCGTNSGDDSGDYFAGDDDNHTQLMDSLRVPDPDGDYDLNPRKIVFLEAPVAKNVEKPKSGIGGNRRFYDPWGRTYRVRIDNNYNNRLPNPYDADTGAGFSFLNTGVIVFSLGKDGEGGSGPKNSGSAEDDVISWQ